VRTDAADSAPHRSGRGLVRPGGLVFIAAHGMNVMLPVRAEIKKTRLVGRKSCAQQVARRVFCLGLLVVTTDNKRFHMQSPV
jgi:hypothetical protein